MARTVILAPVDEVQADLIWRGHNLGRTNKRLGAGLRYVGTAEDSPIDGELNGSRLDRLAVPAGLTVAQFLDIQGAGEQSLR